MKNICPNKRVDRTAARLLRYAACRKSLTRLRDDVPGLTVPVGHLRRSAVFAHRNDYH